MRLKTYTAATMAEAMSMVRTEMGEDAIIVSTQPGAEGSGARVTAALEEVSPDQAPSPEATPEDGREIIETLRHVLAFHGLPPRLSDRLMDAAAALEADDAIMALGGAIDSLFSFSSLIEAVPGRPVMLVGPPGAGKTITTAKLAALDTLNAQPVGVITADTQRAGGVEQLAAFARILKLDLQTADTAKSLSDAIGTCGISDRIYIDTPGTNPLNDAEMEHLSELIKASGADPVLVLAAGGDVLEAADIAATFAMIGVNRILVTRLDMARRFGSILMAADAARMTLCGVSVTPHVGDGLSPINPVSLARLMMPHAKKSKESPLMTEATP